MDPLTITRSIRIDAATDAVWASVADGEGLAGWLGASVDLDVVPGAAGTLVDHDGRTRRLVVTEVDAGTSVGFTWWDHERPNDASRVTISVDRDGDGARVTVTETLAPAAEPVAGSATGRASASVLATVADLAADVGSHWDARLASLLGSAAPALALAVA